eukprot:TRINITY_DN15699_c0_g1_i1.p1 TRINITY_DN15699_c0_g1~~TRINITY_DN15699_c0_g1_i1.p1  ORF type:complete len:448 (+),score=103.96 TRINITY_DN15699_c0_g1_i1:108-1451(+)
MTKAGRTYAFQSTFGADDVMLQLTLDRIPSYGELLATTDPFDFSARRHYATYSSQLTESPGPLPMRYHEKEHTPPRDISYHDRDRRDANELRVSPAAEKRSADVSVDEPSAAEPNTEPNDRFLLQTQKRDNVSAEPPVIQLGLDDGGITILTIRKHMIKDTKSVRRLLRFLRAGMLQRSKLDSINDDTRTMLEIHCENISNALESSASNRIRLVPAQEPDFVMPVLPPLKNMPGAGKTRVRKRTTQQQKQSRAKSTPAAPRATVAAPKRLPPSQSPSPNSRVDPMLMLPMTMQRQLHLEPVRLAKMELRETRQAVHREVKRIIGMSPPRRQVDYSPPQFPTTEIMLQDRALPQCMQRAAAKLQALERERRARRSSSMQPSSRYSVQLDHDVLERVAQVRQSPLHFAWRDSIDSLGVVARRSSSLIQRGNTGDVVSRLLSSTSILSST